MLLLACNLWNASCEMQDARCNMWNASCDMLDATCEMRVVSFCFQENSAHCKFSLYKFGPHKGCAIIWMVGHFSPCLINWLPFCAINYNVIMPCSVEIRFETHTCKAYMTILKTEVHGVLLLDKSCDISLACKGEQHPGGRVACWRESSLRWCWPFRGPEQIGQNYSLYRGGQTWSRKKGAVSKLLGRFRQIAHQMKA